MLGIYSANGRLLRTLSAGDGPTTMGFHPVVGFVTEASLRDRLRRRERAGVRTRGDGTCRFRFVISRENGAATVRALDGCRIDPAPTAAEGWMIEAPTARFRLAPLAGDSTPVPTGPVDAGDRALKRSFAGALLVVALLFATQLLIAPEPASDEPQIIETVRVTVVPETKRIVTVPKEEISDPRFQDKVVKRAVQENLGFLGLLGKKDLKKALGGVPTNVKDASPGAGAGGKEGSGGELLMGLGKGLKRATVGNSGVAGLGGIGTKGAGGGAGGYGDSQVGSGDGKSLSKMALSNELEVQGGLDRSVILATIAKYMSQVRACYESELQRQPGIQGTVSTDFVIGGSGDVSTARIRRTSLGNATVESCIVGRMRTWRFPKPVGGVDVKVNYPFLLRPSGA